MGEVIQFPAPSPVESDEDRLLREFGLPSPLSQEDRDRILALDEREQEIELVALRIRGTRLRRRFDDGA